MPIEMQGIHQNGFALLTEERRATGIFGILNIRENTVISSLKKHKKAGVYLSEKSMEKDTEWSINAMRIKTPSRKPRSDRFQEETSRR